MLRTITIQQENCGDQISSTYHWAKEVNGCDTGWSKNGCHNFNLISCKSTNNLHELNLKNINSRGSVWSFLLCVDKGKCIFSSNVKHRIRIFWPLPFKKMFNAYSHTFKYSPYQPLEEALIQTKSDPAAHTSIPRWVKNLSVQEPRSTELIGEVPKLPS